MGGVMYSIRPFHPSDMWHLYNICLLTGDSGKDATDSYIHKNLLGNYYAVPYAVLEPELCFILSAGSYGFGYVLGCKDVVQFAKRAEKEWFPPLRDMPPVKLKSKDDNLINLIQQGYPQENKYPDYPACLHINLLEDARGKGYGRKMIEAYLSKLESLKVKGVHFEVWNDNVKAQGFYKHLGFQVIDPLPDRLIFGMRL